MNRRNILQLFAGLGSLGLVPQALRAAARPAEDVDRYAEAVVRFAAQNDGLNAPCWASALSLGTLPVSFRVREPERGESPSELEPLVERLQERDPTAADVLTQVFDRLWDRWKPVGPRRWEVRRFDLQSPQGNKALPDRIGSPRYVVDIAELTPWRLACVFVGVRGVVRELEMRVASVESYVESCGRRGKQSYLQYKRLAVDVKQDAYLLEVFCWLEAAGLMF